MELQTARVQNNDLIVVFLQLLIDYYHQEVKLLKNDEVTNLLESFSENKLWEKYNWYSDSEELLVTIKLLDMLLLATIDERSSFYKSDSVWAIVKKSLNTIQSKLKFPPEPYTFPLGNNWYQFSISLPRLIVAATYFYEAQFGVADQKLRNIMERYIQGFLPTPIESMGWLRNGPNVVMMSVPYFGAHILFGDFYEMLETPDVKTVLDTVNFDIVSSGEGLYPDGGFRFHGALRAYGYMSLSDYVLVSKLFNFTAHTKFNRVLEITEHPTIPLHFGPWFGREMSIGSSSIGAGDLGFYRIDSIAGISCKTKRWLLAFNGQHSQLCAYEADKTNFLLAQFWTFARMMMYEDTKPVLERNLITRYPGVVSFDNEVVELPSRLPTTDQFHAANAITCIAQIGRLIGFYTRFNFRELNVKVWEMILVDEISDGHYVMTQIRPMVKTSGNMIKSANLGVAGVRLGKGFSAIYKFPHDYTHIFQGTPKLTSVVGDDGTKYKSLQILPDSEGYLSYATLGKSEHKMRSFNNINKKIELEDVSLYFDEERKWLILKKGKSVSIGISSETMPKVISLKQTDVFAVLGRAVTPVNGKLFGNSYKFAVNRASLSVEFTFLDDGAPF